MRTRHDRAVTLDAFTRAYIDAALWSTTDMDQEAGNDLSLEQEGYTVDDIAQETLDDMIADCARFQADNGEDLATGEGGNSAQGPFSADERAGHDFWLTRCGHGCGFWDGDWSEPAATVLTSESAEWGNVDLYVGDDGQIYA